MQKEEASRKRNTDKDKKIEPRQALNEVGISIEKTGEREIEGGRGRKRYIYIYIYI